MRAMGIALAVCSAAVLHPSTARADAIRGQTAALSCALKVEGSATTWHSADQPWSEPIVSAHHSEGLEIDDDATFDRRGGLEQSALFANQGSADVFADDRSSFHDDIRASGLGVSLERHITIALREHRGDEGREPVRLRADPSAAASPTPEPASWLLIGTGVAGLFAFRKQLFV
jgi:PEP-CTERM motif